MKNQILVLVVFFFCAEISAQEKVELLALDFVNEMMNKASFSKEEGHLSPPTNVINNHAQGNGVRDFGEPIDYYAHRLTKKFFVEVTHYIDDTLNFQIMVYNHRKYRLVQANIVYAGTDLIGFSVLAVQKPSRTQRLSGEGIDYVYWYNPKADEVWIKTNQTKQTSHGYQDVTELSKSKCSDPDDMAPLLKLALR